MSPAAQVIVAIGVAGLLLMLGCLGVIWSVRCDAKRSHFRLPTLVTFAGPVSAAVLVWLRMR